MCVAMGGRASLGCCGDGFEKLLGVGLMGVSVEPLCWDNVSRD